MGLVMSRLGDAAWEAGLAIRESEFGKVLRHARTSSSPGASSVELPGPSPNLQGWELSFDPAVQRTVVATVALTVMGQGVPEDSHNWLQWIASAKRALQRIAAKCWAGVPRECWQTFLDFDDITPLAAQGQIFELRRDVRGAGALNFGGLSNDLVRTPLEGLFSIAKQSKPYEDALQAADTITKRQEMLRHLAEERNRVLAELARPQSEEIGADFFARSRRTIINAYSSDAELKAAVSKLRAYNDVITKVVWTLLGLCEEIEPTVVRTLSRPVTETVSDGHRFVDLTISESLTFHLRPTNPVRLELNTPLDGIYFVQGHTLAWSAGSSDESDIHLLAFD